MLSEAASDDPSTETNESEAIQRGYFVIRDRPALTSDDITDPEQSSDPITNQPTVVFNFTAQGARRFEALTRRIAERGQKHAPSGLSEEVATTYSDHFAVILDGEIVSRPIIDFVSSPDGISGRNGAQIEGSFTIQEAKDLAQFLKIGSLPLELTLIESRD